MADAHRLTAEPAAAQRAAAEYLASGPPADEREAGFQATECERCGAAVLVAKFSPQHTSVQWNAESMRACAEFSARIAAGEQTALVDSCASLHDSIDRAVLEGRLEVLPP
jgi:hypothetical protein